jgi:hypothetical protein
VAYARYDPDTQLEHTRDRYELVQGGEVVRREVHERSPATRGYSYEQAVALYERAGFSVEQVVTDFTLEPYDPSRPQAHDPAANRVFTIFGRKGG